MIRNFFLNSFGKAKAINLFKFKGNAAKCYSISALSRLRNEKTAFKASLICIPKRTYFLETTIVRLNALYDESSEYLQSLIKERNELSLLASDDTDSNKESSKQDVFKRLSYLDPLCNIHSKIIKLNSDLKELTEMEINEGDEMMKMVKEDILKLETELFDNKVDLLDYITPQEDEDKEHVLVELSAGIGGLESRIFCSEMFEMYRSYSQFREWTFTPVKIFTDLTVMGEMMRQSIIEITGQNVFKYMKFESGVHRVQRVPKTESKGRIHTSTVGVVVIPKPIKISIDINPKDLKIETKTAGGPGGQHVNKTESAVRITHLPTGIVVYSDEERQQRQNRVRAMSYLEQKLYQNAYEAQLNKRQASRKMQIGSSARSERIRTYNYIQDRITDHRLKENFQSIQRFLSGTVLLHNMIENLKHEQQIEILTEIFENFKNKAS